MPENATATITTTGTATPISLQAALGWGNSRRSWTVTVYNTANGTASGTILVGRNGGAVGPLATGLSMNFDFARAGMIAFNDQGISGIQIVVDDSGPLDPGDLIVSEQDLR